MNVDKSPIHKEDGELLRAQNCIIDPLGVEGGIRKRPGLLKVNSSAAAGAIQGITPVPIAKPTTRTFIFGRYTSNTVSGWNTSTDGFTTSPTTGGPDTFDATNAVPRAPTKLWPGYNDASTGDDVFAGRPSVTYRNRFYYAGNDYTLNTTAPTVHMWDGTTDYVLAHVPPSADVGTQSLAIVCMIAANQRIYFTTYDGGSAAATTVKARVFELDPEDGSVAQLGSRFPISADTQRGAAYSLAWHMGRLWTSAAVGPGGLSSTKTYFIRPGIDTDWTLDNTSSTTGDSIANMLSFQGQLYLGHAKSSAGVASIVRVRSTLAAYSTSLTAALNEGGAVPVMTSFGIWQHFGAMAVFNSNLYVAYYNRATDTTKYARVYKYTGSAWSVVYSPAVDNAASVPYHGALVHNGVLYMWSSPTNAESGATDINQLIYTTDGTTWTSVGTSLLDSLSASEFGVIVT